MKKNVAILISGGGTTAEATIKAAQNGKLGDINIHVISSNPNAKGNDRVKNLGITPHILDKENLGKDFDQKLFQLLEKLEVDIISLQGFIHLIPKDIVNKYQGKIFNQHPGPMDPGNPDFGGAGMSTPYRVNSALLAYVWVTGEDIKAESDTHFVTEEFDMGDLIRTEQMEIPRKENPITLEDLRENLKELIETTKEVQEKFYPIEHKNVIATLKMFIDGKAKGFKREKPLINKENIAILNECKKLAMEIFPKYNL